MKSYRWSSLNTSTTFGLSAAHEAFASQTDKPWFDEEVLRGLMRLRGMECRSPRRYAEAFHAAKLVAG